MTSHDRPPQQPAQPAWAAPSGAPAGGPKWARKRVIIPAAVVLFLVGVGIGGSGDGRTTTAGSAEPAPTVTRTVTVTVSPAAAPDADAPATEAAAPARAQAPAPSEAERATVPDFVGMVLQTAQDTAQAEGFFLLTSHDSTGAGRMQVLDRNWRVCSQSRAAGTSVPTSTTLDFGAVKLEESCP